MFVRRLVVSEIVFAFLAWGTVARAATDSWVGNTSVNWADGNWNGVNNPPASGDSLVFAASGSFGTSLNDNLTSSSSTIGGITFNAGAPAYSISGNAFMLSGTVANNSTSLQTISDAITLATTATFTGTAGGGSVTLSGNIGQSGAGTPGITKTGSGILTLTGANSYYGPTTVSTAGVASGGCSVVALLGAGALNYQGNQPLINLSNSNAATATILEISTSCGKAIGTSNTSGDIDMAGGGNGSFMGFAAVGGNQIVNLASGGTLQYKNTGLPGGGGDGFAFGAPNATGTIIFQNPINLYSAGSTRAFMTIRGVGSVPEGDFTGVMNNVVAGNANGPCTMYGNGGLIFSNTANTIQEYFTVQGGVLYAGGNDPANGTAGVLGTCTTGVVLGNANTLTQNIGFLTFGSGTTGGAASPSITVARGISVTNNGTGSATLGGATADYSVMSGTISIAKATNFVAATGGRVNFSGNISGAGAANVGGNVVVEGDASTAGITIPAGGMVVFSGTNTYSGATNVNGGILEATTTAALPGYSSAGTIAVVNGATLAVQVLAGSATKGWSDAAIAGLEANPNVTFAAGSSLGIDVVGGGTYSSSANYSLGGGSNGLVKLGAGAFVLTSSTAYSGPTSIVAGTLQLGGTNTGGGPTGSLSTVSSIADNGTLVFNRSNPVAQGADFSSSGITGSGAVTQMGASSLTLNAANSYSGGTTLSAGTLVVGNAGALGSGTLTINGGALDASAPVTLSTYAVPELWNANFAWGGSNPLNMGSGAVTLGANRTLALGGAALTIGGPIGDSNQGYGLTLTGAGKLVLAANNTYGGPTTISAGTLQIGNGGGTGSLSPNSAITDNGALVFNSSNTLMQGVNFASSGIAGSGSLTQAGNGGLVMTVANTYSGSTTLSAGTLVLNGSGGNSGSLGATAVTVNGGAVLAVQGNSSIAAGGSLIVAGGPPASQGVVDLRDGAINTFSVNGNLGLGNGATGSQGSVLYFDVGSGVDRIAATGAATVAGSNTINLDSVGSIAAGSYPLITASSGLLAGNFTVGAKPAGFYTFSLASSAGNSELVLNIAGNPVPATAYWTGSASSALGNTANNWGVGSNINTSNWSTNAAGTTDALQIPGASTNVVFNAASAAGGPSGMVATALDNSYSINSLTFGVSAGTITGVTINTSGNLLTIGSGGLTLTGDSHASASIGGTGGVAVNGSQSWANNSNTQGLAVGTAVTASSGASTLTLNGTGSGGVTLGGAIANGTGTLALTLDQAGVTLLSGSNTYSGPTNIVAGTLQLGSSSSLPAGTAATVNGLLDLNTFNASLGSLSGSGTVDTVAGGSPTLAVGNSAACTFGGTIRNSSGTLALQKAGSGTLYLTGVNTYGGGTQINGGVLSFTANALPVSNIAFGGGILQWAAGNTQDISAGIAPIATGQTAIIDTNGNTVNFAFNLSGDGGLTKLGAGMLTLSGNDVYGGRTNVSAGTLQIGSATGLPAGTAATVNGLLDLNQNSVAVSSLSGSGTIDTVAGGSPTLTVSNSAACTFAGTIQNSSGALALQKAGSGTLYLAGTNTYGGGTQINSGVLNFSASALPFNSVAPNIIFGGGTLQWAAGNTLDVSAGIAPIAAGKAAIIDTNGNTVTFASNLSGAGGLTKTGAGTLILTGSNSYAGTTTVNTAGVASGGASVLAVLSPSALGSGNLNMSNSNANTSTILEISSGFSSALGTAAGDINMQTGSSGEFIGFAAYGGPQSVTIAGTLTYKSPYFINGGGDGLAFGAPTATDTLTFASPFDIYQSNGNTRQFMTIRGVGTVPEGNLAGAITNQTVANPGTGVTTFVGNGGLIFSNESNNFNATMTIQGGAVYAGGNDPANGVSTGVFGNGTTTMMLGNGNTLSQNIGLLTYGSGQGLAGGGESIVVARNITVNNDGTGTTTLGGATADWTALNGNITLNKTTHLVAPADGRVDFGGVISGSGSVIVGGNVVVEGDANTPGITIPGFGIVEFSGSNTYSGTTTIAGGTLQLGNADVNYGSGTASINPSSTIIDNGTLVFNCNSLLKQGAQFSTAGISGSGSLVQAGASSTVVLNAANTYSGPTNILAGTLQLGSSSGLPAGTAATVNGLLDLNQYSATVSSLFGDGTIDTVAGGSPTLTVSNSAACTFAGAIQNSSGTLTLQKAGSGTLCLTSMNTYGGGTVINGGTLQIGNAGALGDSSGGVSMVAGMLDLNGQSPTVGPLSGGTAGVILTSAAGPVTLSTSFPGNSTFAGTLSDGAGKLALVVQGSGQLTLSGSGAYSGGTFVEGGTVIAANSEAFEDGSNLYVGTSSFPFGTVVAAGQSASASGTGGQDAAAAVPEPGTLALLGAATMFMVLYRPRKKRTVTAS